MLSLSSTKVFSTCIRHVLDYSLYYILHNLYFCNVNALSSVVTCLSVLMKLLHLVSITGL